jgi:hypothetical protein
MPIENVYFKTEAAIDWRWPLRVGVMGATEDTIALLKDRYNLFRFCTIFPLTKGGAYDIVLVNDFSFDRIRSIDEFYFHANVILLQKNKLEIKDPVPLGRTFIKMAQKKKCAGIFIFLFEGNWSSGLDELVRRLANDMDVVSACDEIYADSHFFYDERLKIETRISYVFEKLKGELETRHLTDYLKQDEFPYLDPDRRIDPVLLLKWAKPRYDLLRETAEVKRRSISPLSDIHLEKADFNLKELLELLDPSRYLQAKILSFEQRQQITESLSYTTVYLLLIRIGLSETGWSKADHSFPDSKVFEDSTNQQETILIVFIYGQEPVIEYKELTLPRFGNSAEIDFPFVTANSGELFTGDIYAYHKGRILQKITIEIPYENYPGKGLQLKETFIARRKLNNLDMRLAFATSLFYDSKSDANDKLSGLVGKEPIHLNLEDPLKDLLKEIRDTIEIALTEVEDDGQTPKAKEDINDPYNVELLRDLALMGNTLYVDHLKRKELTGPLQIVTNRNEFIPLDFVYTFPAPSEEATLCENALDALQNGACKGCLKDKNAPAPHVCPFGFLGISDIIERHTTETQADGKSDYMIRAEPSIGRNILTILKQTLYASSNRVAALTPNLEADIETCLNACTKFSRAGNWKEWTTAIGKEKPDTQIMLVHVESDAKRKTKLEIGNELMLQNYFEPSTIKSSEKDQSPLMIVMGCETTNIENYAFDISNRLINCGAAIVLSNFTKIRGRHAGIILMTLVELLSADPGKEKSLGEIIVRLKQLLLAKGIMASLALVALGDADWKIKK